MRLLDLYCGAGGATKGYQRAGFQVTGVDIAPQPNYCGDAFIQADALEVSLEGFDVIHASPPCQRYSRLGSRYDREAHPDLVGPTRERLVGLEVPFIIENVEDAPLRSPVRLCGSSFGLGVRRHRLFETNFPLLVPPCNHHAGEPRFDIYNHGQWSKSRVAYVFGQGGGKAKDQWADAMGIDWMSLEEIVEAIPPAFTEFIGRALLEQRSVA